MAGHALSGCRQAGALTERLWRLRKDHRVIEALICSRTGSTSVTLSVHYNWETTSTSRWPTHEAAAREADVRLREFLRQGWATHW